MWKCNEHVGLAAAILISNVWLLTDRMGRRFLIDTSFKTDRHLLYLALRRAGVRQPGDLTAILLTHRHTDHAGNARWLKKRFGCPIVCHEDDASILNGEKDPQPIKRGYGGPLDELLCGVEDRWPIRCPIDETFTEGVWKHGWRIFNAYGHTEGSSILYHEPTRSLFTGDALLTGLAVTRWPKLYLAVKAYSIDQKACHRHTIEFLKDAPPIDGLCSGHGPFLKGEVNDRLKKFLATVNGAGE